MEKEVKKFKKKSKLSVFLTVIISVVIVLLIVIIGAQKLGNMTISAITSDVKTYFMQFGAGDGFPYNISSDSIKSIKINNSNLYLLSKNKTQVLTSTAKEIFESEHGFSSPVMKNNGSKIIVYDLDSGKYRVQTSSNIIIEDEADFNIMSAAIGRKGNYAIAAYCNDAQSLLTVYSSGQKKVFSHKFDTERIIDISLSDNGKYAAVAAVNAKSGSMYSTLYVFSFNSDEPVAVFDYPSTMLIKVNYVRGTDIITVGDNLRSYIKNNKTREDDISFDSDSIHNFVIAPNGVNAEILSRYGSSELSSLLVYSNKNKELARVDFENEVKAIDCDGKYIAVLFDSEVRTYDKNGKEKGTIFFNGTPINVAVDGKRTYVLTTAGLQCFNTNGTTDERVKKDG